jgi:CubicO group peptidase (beta-lactamase class C family)
LVAWAVCAVCAHAQPPAQAAAPRPAAGARLAPADSLPQADLEAFVDGVAAEAMARNHIAGAVVSVVQDGTLVLAKGYGVARVDPWRRADPARTLFRLGDVSQAMTWLLVLQQVGQGHMRMDAPANLYLPESLRIRDAGRLAPVRLEDLVRGESGFDERALGRAFERDVDLVRPLQQYLREERPRRVREPGALPGPTDYGAALAGAAVAEVTGQPFETLVERNITGPLGLRRTSFREPHPPRAGLAAGLPSTLALDLSDGYRWSATGLRLRPFEYIEQRAPSGSASASATDMARLMSMLLAGGTLDGVRIIGPQAAAFLLTPQAPSSAPAPRGLADLPLPGGFRGVGVLGDTLSFHTSLVLAPALRLGVFVSANTDTGGPFVRSLAGRIVQRFYAAPPAPQPAGGGLLEHKDAYQGAWLSDDRAQGGLQGFVDHLRRVAFVQVLDDQRLSISGPGGVSRWIAEPAPGRFRDLDGPGELVFGGSDRPATFFPPGSPLAFERAQSSDRPLPFLGLSLGVALLALAVLADFPARLRQSFRESRAQSQAAVLQAIQAVLWLAAIVLFAVWAWQARDPASAMYDWPGVPLVTASSCALVAAALCLPQAMLLPLVWRGGRRVESWNAGRKFVFTLIALVFLAYAVLVGLWGGLQPWSA